MSFRKLEKKAELKTDAFLENLDEGAEAMLAIRRLIGRAFAWGEVEGGFDFWHEAFRNLAISAEQAFQEEEGLAHAGALVNLDECETIRIGENEFYLVEKEAE